MLFEDILILIIIWSLCLGTSNAIILKYKKTYYNSPHIFVLWFLCWISVCYFVFPKYLDMYFIPTGIFLTAPAMFGVLFVIKMLSFEKVLKDRNRLQAMYDTMSKFVEIAFQQVVIYLLVVNLQDLYYFTIVFFILHLPLFLFLNKVHALTFIVPSILGGVIFYLLISNLYYGTVFSFILHVIFYVLLDILFYKRGYTPVSKAMIM